MFTYVLQLITLYVRTSRLQKQNALDKWQKEKKEEKK